MTDVITLVTVQKNTFEDFRKWLFEKLQRNRENFSKFGKSNNRIKLPYLVEYLEYKQVPILEALPYYNCKSSNQATNFEELVLYMVVEEFKRLELKKSINYTPF